MYNYDEQDTITEPNMPPVLITISLEMAVRGLLHILDVFGSDHKANNGQGSGCVYATLENGVLRPVCIVGQFFANLGLLGMLVPDGESSAPYTYWSEGVGDNRCNLGGFSVEMRRYLRTYGIDVTREARVFLSEAQGKQDGGATWGKAVEHALEYMAVSGLLDLENTSYTDRARLTFA